MSIDYEAIASYAAGLSSPTYQAQASLTDSDLESRRLLVLALDTINFGSGWHDVVTKRPGLSGARTMAASLRDFESSVGGLNPEQLQSLDPEQCVAIFGQDQSNSPAVELMTLFSQALADLGRFVESNKSATRLIESSNHSAVALAEKLTEMDSFNDVGYFKRAQIACADLAREGLAQFEDLEELTAFADNLVPHVLVIDQVVILNPELGQAIAAGELLEVGGRAEAELRAVAVHVVEMLKAERPQLRAMDIDAHLWWRGSNPRYKAHPRPRCRTVWY